MGLTPELNERDLNLLLRYSIESDEEMAEAVVNAFLAADLQIFERPTQFVDLLNVEVFDSIQWTDDRPLYICTRIWNHTVVLTPAEVRIYRELEVS